MGGKHWHPKHKRLARLRALYWTLIRLHETEICALCGGPVHIVFHVPDSIWEAVTGYGGRRDTEAAPGVLCPPCVTDLARDAGLFLHWTCDTEDWPMVFQAKIS
jgi:hypothetical protein